MILWCGPDSNLLYLSTKQWFSWTKGINSWCLSTEMSFWWTKFIETDSMKKIIGILAVMGLSFACQQVELPVEQEHVSGPEFTAQAEMFGAQTKTAMDGNSVVWNAGDQIAIFQGLSTADKYQVKEDGVGKTSATFGIVANGDGSGAAELPTNLAIYPYESDLVCASVTAENGAVTSYQISGVTIQSTQTYTANSFADDSFIMTALTNGLNDHNLKFKNVCGALKLQLKGTAKVKSIELKGNDNEPLSGDATVTIYPGEATPTIAMSADASNTVTLDCGDGVQLNETTATDFLITIPPTAFEKGFAASITDVNGGTAELKTSKSNTVQRSYIHTMPELVIDTKKEVDLFIFMGQSNMSGFGGDATLAPEVPEGWGYEYKAISNPDGLLHMVDPFGLNEDNTDSGVSGTKRAGTLVPAFTNAYYENTGIPVVGVSCSRGSTDTDFWMPRGKPLEDAINRHLSAENWLRENGYVIRNNYMVWLQGESDSGKSVKAYKSNLIDITREMISRTGVTNCMIIRIGKQNPVTSSFDKVIQAQTELSKEYGEFVMASTLAVTFPDEGLMSDGVHYTQEGYNLLGADAGKNVAYYVNNGQEPSMYDSHYSNTYHPAEEAKSIFDAQVDEPEDEPAVITYLLNKNINANDEIVDAPGLIAILDYFESDGSRISVSTPFDIVRSGVRYYDSNKELNGTWSNYEGSVYGRVVCYINDTQTPLDLNVCDGKTIIINGITYVLQQAGTAHILNSPYDFSGKKAFFFGDSITYGYIKNADGSAARATKGGYPGFFSEAVGLTHTNCGVSGSLFGTYNNLGRIGDKIKNRSLDCDFLFVAGGINDWQCGVSLSDFRQAVEEVCSYIDANFDGEVIFITPINHSGRVPIVEPVAEVQDYREIITEIALSHNFSVVQGGLFGFPTTDSPEAEKTLMFCDNLHPTEYGYEFYANCLIEVLDF